MIDLIWNDHRLDILARDADDDGIFLPFLTRAEKDGMSFGAVPKMGAENEAILQVRGVRIHSILSGLSVELAEEVNELFPV